MQLQRIVDMNAYLNAFSKLHIFTDLCRLTSTSFGQGHDTVFAGNLQALDEPAVAEMGMRLQKLIK